MNQFFKRSFAQNLLALPLGVVGGVLGICYFVFTGVAVIIAAVLAAGHLYKTIYVRFVDDKTPLYPMALDIWDFKYPADFAMASFLLLLTLFALQLLDAILLREDKKWFDLASGVMRVTGMVTTIGYIPVFIFSGGSFGPDEPTTLLAALLITAPLAWILGASKFRYWLLPSNFQANKVQVPRAEGAPDQISEVARKEKPSITFADIYGNADIKRRLLEAGRAITARRAEGQAPRNGILMTGDPGNGKTVLAEALAGELKLNLLKLTHADVASRWVGERTQRIKVAFDQAIKAQPCVLFIDEIDSFLPERSGPTQVKEDTDVVNALLTLLVDVRKHKVLVMAATNFYDRLDPAAVREGRFDFKVEITPPDEEARLGLLRHGLKRNLPKGKFAEATLSNVASRWNGFSVKRILAVTEELPGFLADKKHKGEIGFDEFMGALRALQGSKGSTPENVIPLDQLVLPDHARETLDMIASRLRDPVRVERLGGSLPTGVLFHGPAGTGKTSVAKALAKEAGYAFLPTTGTELAREPKELDKIYSKAKEMRPTIIFIDEGDDLIRSRDYSANTAATNKLLTLMDGVGDRVRDVIWVVATNHPDQIDAALLRGGRFTEKVSFELPQEDQLTVHVQKWLGKRNVRLQDGLDAGTIMALVGAESIANVEAVLQAALNRAISRVKDDDVIVQRADIEAAVRIVLSAT